MLHISLADSTDSDILVHLDTTTEFIRNALTENDTNQVLVHCVMGISRSATVVCAYLIATQAMQAHEALEFVIARRRIVCPNLGFRRQLELYAARCAAKGAKAKTPASRRSKGISVGVAERIRKFKASALGHHRDPAAGNGETQTQTS
ncbi:phosphatases II [Panus rudis PR-1116 ss-1]|nr:phosphatases II [Panus rudis PR-1116 ss-1]